jgi:hypothetical protein
LYVVLVGDDLSERGVFSAQHCTLLLQVFQLTFQAMKNRNQLQQARNTQKDEFADIATATQADIGPGAKGNVLRDSQGACVA